MTVFRVRHMLPVLAAVSGIAMGGPIGAQTLVAQQTTASRVVEATTPRKTADATMNKLVSVSLDNVPVRKAVDLIALQAKVRVLYQVELLNAIARPVSLRAEGITLRAALDKVLAGTDLQASPMMDNLVVIRQGAAGAEATDGVIVGRVIDARTKEPLVGATVWLDDAQKGVVTERDGTFRIPASSGEHTVHVRAVGFSRQSKTVRVAEGGSAEVSFTLEASASVLNQVIVTGTIVETERKAISTPITVITAAEIEKRGITSISQFLRGEVPGVIALDRGTQSFTDKLGSNVTANVYSRGASSLIGGSSPLKVYVDGVELLDPAYLGTIDVQTIERMEIVTGPQAATVYGSGAMGGVMQIFTKKGAGSSRPEVRLSLRYGILENNFTDGHTPSHADALNVTGGTGPSFSYAGSFSYNYTGQWQPALFNRGFGGSIGATHKAGPLTVDGSVGLQRTSNGTMGGNTSFCGYDQYNNGCVVSPYLARFMADGHYTASSTAPAITQRVSRSASQNMTVNADYRIASFWQHHLTLGRSQSDFQLVPEAPKLTGPSDTMFQASRSNSGKNSASYNTTLMSTIGAVTATGTLGANRVWGDGSSITGCLTTKNSTTYVGCYNGGTISASQPANNDNWGGFGSWRLGFFDKLFLNVGVRGERNVNYGQNHKIDWTPTSGAAYTMEFNDLTLKILGSYGRSTRPPQAAWRDEKVTFNSYGLPAQYLTQAANPDLGPEYSVGPQGGIEVYYGNIGSLTINHYQQQVTNMIQALIADTVFLADPNGNSYGWSYTTQYLNVADVRQMGWEGTGSVSMGPLSLKGTYSWNDSRVRKVSPLASNATFRVGDTFVYVPTHTGNIIASYALGGTSVTLTTNWVGSSIQLAGTGAAQLISIANQRVSMYSPRKNYFSNPVEVNGTLKSDLAMSQRFTPNVTGTLNITNLGNRFASDFGALYPTLGRQTLIGLTVRR